MPHDLKLTGLKNCLEPIISTSAPDATSTPARSQRTLQAPPELQERAPRQASPERSRAAPRTDLSQKLEAFAQLNRDDSASKTQVGSPPAGQEGQAPAPAPASTPAPATTPIADDAAQIAEVQATATAENRINLAIRQAKVATMGLKAAKDLIG